MATVTDNKVISNQVFTAIQQSKSYEAHTGTIIYANKYSGLQEVPMPETFKTILDSGLGSIGTNPLQQLRAKLEGLPGGPWFLDSRNGTIYIHNRKFQEDVVHNYVYQAENGEVLQISFETQRTSRSLSHISGGGIDPYSKNLVGTNTGITSESPGPGTTHTAPPKENHTITHNDRKKLLNMRTSPGQEALPIDALRNVNRTAKNWTDRQNSMYRAERIAIGWRIKRGETEAHYAAYRRGSTAQKQAQNQVRTTRVSRKDKWARHIVNSKLTPQDRMDMTTKAAQSWKSKHSKSEILAWARYYLGYGTHVIVAPVWSEQWVDPTTYSGKGTFNGHATTVSESGSATPSYYSKRTLDYKLKMMKLDPLIKITSPVTTVKGKHYGGREQSYYFRVKVFRYHYERTKVDSAQIVADYMVRMLKQIEGSGGSLGGSSNIGGGVKITLGGGSGGGSYTGSIGDDTGTISENRHGNRGRRATEKKLVVNMKVIGRPSLETSQIIHIDNVGSKWSGDYYIKSVSHDMSPDSGYTCQMELQRNSSQAEIESVSVQASTEKVVRDNDDSNRDRKYTHTQTDSKSSRRDRKIYTSTRTKSTSSKPNNTKQADKK